MRARRVPSPLGELTLVSSGAGLAGVAFDAARWPAASPAPADVEEVGEGDDDLLDAAAAQLTAYLGGEQVGFDLAVDLTAVTPFRRAVYAAMRAVPHGEVATYGDLARAVGRPRAARAVGGACNANPLPIVVPCHRVVAADGSLGGYGAGLDVKRHLLELERGTVPAGGWPSAAERASAPRPAAG